MARSSTTTSIGSAILLFLLSFLSFAVEARRRKDFKKDVEDETRTRDGIKLIALCFFFALAPIFAMFIKSLWTDPAVPVVSKALLRGFKRSIVGDDGTRSKDIRSKE